MLIALVAPPAAACLSAPVAAPVIEPFRAPPCPYCAGHRGITYGTAPGATVRAAASGTVTFAGTVAGTRYVVIAHVDGRRATYGGLRVVLVGEGVSVVQGQALGISGTRLYFGLRRGDVYLDPLPLLARRIGRAHLVPTDGTPGRSAGRAVCPAGGSPRSPG